jgi:hypothetical protein
MNNNLESFRRDARYSAAYPAKVGLGLLKAALFLLLGIFAFGCIVGLLGAFSSMFGGS